MARGRAVKRNNRKLILVVLAVAVVVGGGIWFVKGQGSGAVNVPQPNLPLPYPGGPIGTSSSGGNPNGPITNAQQPLNPTAGFTAISLPVSVSDPILGFLTPGDRIDILFDQSGSVTYVAQDLRILRVTVATGAGGGGAAAAQASGAAAPTGSSPSASLVIEVREEQFTYLTSLLSGNADKIHYAVHGTPTATPVPTATPTPAPTSKPKASPTPPSASTSPAATHS